MNRLPLPLPRRRRLCYLAPMRPLDFHTHAFSPWARERRLELARRDPLFGAIYADPKAKMVGVEEIIALVEKEGLRGAVVCGFPWTDPDLCKRENDYILESCEGKEGLFPFVTFTPDDRGLKELERARRYGARGAGELAPGTYGRGPLDPGLLEELFSAIRSFGLIALLHVNEPVGHPYPGKGDITPKDIELILRKAQGVPLVLAHLGAGFPFFELMPEIRELAVHVYYDTAAAPLLYSPKVYRVLSEIAPERVLFGTDYPLLGPRRYLEGIQEAGLPEALKEAILFRNAQRLLGWDSPGGSS